VALEQKPAARSAAAGDLGIRHFAQARFAAELTVCFDHKNNPRWRSEFKPELSNGHDPGDRTVCLGQGFQISWI
jgi:hypothetical protein